MDFDKQQHYDFCRNATKKAPKILRPIYGLGVFIGVSIYKEVINDLLLKRGTPDWGDVAANAYGVLDAILERFRDGTVN